MLKTGAGSSELLLLVVVAILVDSLLSTVHTVQHTLHSSSASAARHRRNTVPGNLSSRHCVAAAAARFSFLPSHFLACSSRSLIDVKR